MKFTGKYKEMAEQFRRDGADEHLVEKFIQGREEQTMKKLEIGGKAMHCNAEAAIEHIKNELDDLEFQRDSRLIDKAELAVQEVQIRSLLKVIDQKAGVNPPEGCAVRIVTEAVEGTLKQDGAEENVPEAADEPEESGESGKETGADCGEIPCEHVGACYDLADFYDRTDRIPEDTAFYSEDLVKRYIQSITVKAKYLVVKFKAGVEIDVKA